MTSSFFMISVEVFTIGETAKPKSVKYTYSADVVSARPGIQFEFGRR